MTYRRRSIRLPYYDYSKEGCYFITICTQERLHLFGKIVDGVMVLGEAGEMVYSLWYEIMVDFSNVQLHEFVIMPNHIHGIIEIVDTVGADSISARERMDANEFTIEYERMNVHEQTNTTNHQRADMESAPTLSKIVQSFKRHTTLQYIKMVKNNILPPFNKRIWQRNYHEHVIRNDADYLRIAEYTINNPLTWENDIFANKC